MSSSAALAAFLFCVGPAQTFAETSSLRARVIVRDLEAAEPLAPLARRLTDEILLALSKNGELAVIGQRELELLASHAGDLSAVARCSGDRSCLDALQTAAGAEKILTGKLARFDAGFLLTLKLLDASRADFWRGDSCVAASEQELLECGIERAHELFGVLTAAATTPVRTATIAPSKLAVLDLEALGLAPALASSLTEILSLELRKLDGFSVIRPSEVRAMLDYEATKQVVQCESDIECLLEIGGALGVQYLVGGAVGKLEDTWVIHLKLMDVEKADVVNRASESYRGQERELSTALRAVALDLVGRSEKGEGSLLIESPAGDAMVTIDSAPAAPLERFQGPITLAAGKHAIAIRADGYEPYQRDVFVEDRNLTKLSAELIEIPTAWYEKWWVWTIVGAVAAGATTTAVLLSRDDPPGSAHGMVPFPGVGSGQ
jgi:TolB-like protein